MWVTIAVLTVTSRFFLSPPYCKITVKVSSTSLSAPRLARRKAVTEAGCPKRHTAWSRVCDPKDVSANSSFIRKPNADVTRTGRGQRAGRARGGGAPGGGAPGG